MSQNGGRFSGGRHFKPAVEMEANSYSDSRLEVLYEDLERIYQEIDRLRRIPGNKIYGEAAIKNGNLIEKYQSAKDSFLERLDELKKADAEKRLQAESIKRQDELLDLQKEINGIANRGHRLTVRATIFAAIASILSFVSILFSYLQYQSSVRANKLMEIQNEIMREQNAIAIKTLPASSSVKAK